MQYDATSPELTIFIFLAIFGEEAQEAVQSEEDIQRGKGNTRDEAGASGVADEVGSSGVADEVGASGVADKARKTPLSQTSSSKKTKRGKRQQKGVCTL